MAPSNNKKKIIVIVPARGGSKGLFRKNVADLCGKPLIAYTIQTALKSKRVSKVIVSTDDMGIARISERYGAQVPFLRPAEFAQDHSSLLDVVRHAVKKILEKQTVNAYAVLLPTHPFRTIGMIDFLAEKLLSNYQIVRTVKQIKTNLNDFLVRGPEGRLNKIFPEQKSFSQRNLYYFRSYGVFNGVCLSKTSSAGIYFYKLKDPITQIDIDYPKDLALSREIIKTGRFDFDAETV